MSVRMRTSAIGLMLVVWPAASIGQTAETPLAIGSHLVAPRRITYVPPRFDPGAKGIVVLELLIAPDGSVKRVKTKSGGPRLAAQALEAAYQWRYEPTLYRGQPAWILLHATANAGVNGSKVPLNMPSTTVNVADPQPVRLNLQGKVQEIARADLTVVGPKPTTDDTMGRTTKALRMGSILEHLDLTKPTVRSDAPLGKHCGELILKVKTNDGTFIKRLFLHRDGLVQDADQPTIVYPQTFRSCSAVTR